jgi:MtN3 and saliva related transmembrane protein
MNNYSYTQEIIGFIAGTLIIISLLPQLIKIIQSKSTNDVSISTYIILLIATILWSIYGILKNDLQILLTNVISSFIVILIIICVYYFRLIGY